MITEFDEFICSNKDKRFAVTKLKNLNNPENHQSETLIGESYKGQVTLRYFEAEDTEWGKGFIILVDGGYQMRTSLVREVVRKSPTKWLAKTLNSVYRVEVIE